MPSLRDSGSLYTAYPALKRRAILFRADGARTFVGVALIQQPSLLLSLAAEAPWHAGNPASMQSPRQQQILRLRRQMRPPPLRMTRKEERRTRAEGLT